MSTPGGLLVIGTGGRVYKLQGDTFVDQNIIPTADNSLALRVLTSIDGAEYAAGFGVWRRTATHWEVVPASLTDNDRFPTDVRFLTKVGDRLFAGCETNRLLSFNGVRWIDAATSPTLAGQTNDGIEFQGVLHLALGSNPPGVNSNLPPSQSAVYRLISQGLSALGPDLKGFATSLAVYHNELYVAGVMKLPDSDLNEFIHIARWSGSQWTRVHTSSSSSQVLSTLRIIDDQLVLFHPPSLSIAPPAPVAFDGRTVRPFHPELTILNAYLVHDGVQYASGDRVVASTVFRPRLLSFAPSTGPWITEQPHALTPACWRNQVVVLRAAGQPSQLNSPVPLIFRWYRDDQLVSSTSGESSLMSAPRTGRSVYRVNVEDACGITRSQPLVVNFCRSDQNCSGDITVSDLFEYIGVWFNGSAGAEIDGVPQITVADLFGFVQLWLEGCV